MREINYWFSKNKVRLFFSYQEPTDFSFNQIPDYSFLQWIKESGIHFNFLNGSVIQELSMVIRDKTESSQIFEVANSILKQVNYQVDHLEYESLEDFHKKSLHRKQIDTIIESISASELEDIEIHGYSYFIQNEIPLKIYIKEPMHNLYHDFLDQIESDDLPIFDKEWIVKSHTKGGWILTASKPGFLIWDDNSGLSICDPQLKNIYNTHLLGLALRVKNHPQLEEWLRDRKQVSHYHIDSKYIQHILDLRESKIFLIRAGKHPILPKDETLKLNPKLIQVKEIDELSSIDFKEQRAFIELMENEWIATKTFFQEGVAGVDLLGKEIFVGDCKKVFFDIQGPNKSVKMDDGIHYFCSQDCIIQRTATGIRISPSLVIEGDVGPKTGNIRYSKDIIINGTIVSGYEVDCGGNLILRQTPSPGSFIKCHGNILCKEGILGSDTKILAEGDIQAQFVEDATVYAGGNVLISKYTMNAKIYARGWVQIEGQGYNATEKGAMMGGLCNGTKGVWLHSVSSEIGFSLVISGTCLELEKKVEDLRRRQNDLGAKIVQLNLQCKDLLRNSPTNTPNNSNQNMIQRLLEHMSSLSRMKEELGQKIKLLDEESQALVNPQAEIQIKECIHPNCEFQIESISTRIHHKRDLVTPVSYKIYRSYLLEFPEPDITHPPLKFELNKSSNP